jgi:serine/threonine protein kinase/predicted negative regulator of RcsB-dependent stress response
MAAHTSRAHAIVEAAIKRPPSAWMAFVDAACRDDENLRQQVIILLDQFELASGSPSREIPMESRSEGEEPLPVAGAAGFSQEVSHDHLPPGDAERTRIEPPPNADYDKTHILAQPSPVVPNEVSPSVQSGGLPPHFVSGQTLQGRRIGPYQLLHDIGKGGMGTVYAASRVDREYKKIVAIKVAAAGLRSQEILRRFRNERQMLAGLEHPCIARLLDGGTTNDGLPYLVMEFVQGQPIDQYCETHRLSLRDRLRLFQKVCGAVQYAHQNLVIHSDIKPGNILVTASGEPKLLDFGIAKLMTAEFSVEDIELSKGEARPMTLRYASPEQVRGEPISTATDIYSLGILLYELLTGRHPFQTALIGRKEAEKAILTSETEKPSRSVTREPETQIAARRPPEGSRHLRRQLSGDLDAIVLKALKKRPEERYPSAEALSEDLRRYLDGFPVRARDSSVGYSAGKFIRRHFASLIAASVLVLALIASSIISWRLARTARLERTLAESRFNDVRQLANFVLFRFDDAIRSGKTEARELLVKQALGYLDHLAKSATGNISIQRELIDGYLKVGDLQGNPALENLGDTAGARKSYEKALQIATSLQASDPGDAIASDVAKVYTSLGELYLGGDQQEALKYYLHARSALESLAPAGMGDSAKKNLMKIFSRIGAVQLQLGDTNAAQNNFQRSLKIAQELYDASHNDLAALRDVAFAYEQLGDGLAKTGAVPEGLEKLRKAQSIYRQIAASQSWVRTDVVKVTMIIGDALCDHGKEADAVASFQEAVKINEALLAEDPKNSQYRRDLRLALERLAETLVMLKRMNEARMAFQRVLNMLKPIVDSPDAPFYETYQYCWILLTTPFRDLQNPALARHYAEILVKTTHQKDPNTLDLLARAYFANGDASQAEKAESLALTLLPPLTSTDLRTELQENLTKFSAALKHKKTQ